MLTEARKDALVDKLKTEITTWTPTDDLSIDPADMQWIRGGFRIPLKSPAIVITFSDDSLLYGRFLNDVLANPDSKYPIYGFPERNYVEIAAFATDMEDSEGVVVDGLTIASYMIQRLQDYVFFYWRQLLGGYGAHIEFYTHKVRDDSALVEGTQMFKKVLSFTLITTTQWQLTPPDGEEHTLIEEVDLSLDDDAGEHEIIIEVKV